MFTVGEGDFFRTRLTHSLEVAQIGKGLALRLGASTDLVEAVCLIHDIGHPPFGHAGETELKKLMSCYGGFEANAQNIRVLTKLEVKSHYQGLNLTRAVIDGQMKYKDTFPNNTCKFIYEDDIGLLDWAGNEACAVVGESHRQLRSFECEIMDWADDIAYAVHDLEDGVHTGYIGVATFQNQSAIAEVVEEVTHEFKDATIDASKVCRDFINDYLLRQNPDFQVISPTTDYRERKANRKRLTSLLIGRYVRAPLLCERTDPPEKPISLRYLYSLYIPIEYRIEVCLLKKLVMKFVIEAPQIRTLEEKARYIIRCLFSRFMQVDEVEQLLPNDWKGYLKAPYSEKDKARVVSDYIAGMTDHYAQKTYARLFLPEQGSIYEVL